MHQSERNNGIAIELRNVVLLTEPYSLEIPNLRLFAGELVCLTGPNNVGKSALIKAISLQLAPSNRADFVQ